MVSSFDHEISGDEWLYRRICPDDVDYSNGKLRPQSIRVPSVSVNRSGNSRTEDVMEGTYNGVAEMQRRSVPKEIVCQSDPKPRFLVDVRWTPRDNNPAHSEIQVRREGKPYSPNKIKSDGQRQEIQEKLAERFSICILPTNTEEF